MGILFCSRTKPWIQQQERQTLLVKCRAANVACLEHLCDITIGPSVVSRQTSGTHLIRHSPNWVKTTILSMTNNQTSAGFLPCRVEKSFVIFQGRTSLSLCISQDVAICEISKPRLVGEPRHSGENETEAHRWQGKVKYDSDYVTC